MQKKFQVYDWFKTLDGAKRIDFLNGMLHLCFPLELRFLGSCIEELARKDYLYLRDAELKANSIQEIQQFKDICDKITRSKMIVTMALLASNNYECARLLFEFLNIDICQTIDKMKSIYMDAKIADEFLLLLTMAANHPAFDFQMKTKMSHLFITTENKLKSEDIICRDSENEFCLCEKSKYKILMEKNIMNNCLENNEFDKKKSSLTDEPTKVDNNNNKNNKGSFDSTVISKPVFKTSLSSSSISSSNTSLVDNAKIDSEIIEEKEIIKNPNVEQNSNLDTFIESITFEGVRSIKGTDNYKFSIKIHWSDLISSEIHKTYSEICDFNKRLTKMFPNEIGNLMEINSLDSKEDQKEDFVKEMPLVADYCDKLAKLPKEIFKSDLFKTFFIRDFHNNIKREKPDDNIRNEKCDLENSLEKKAEFDDVLTCENKLIKKENTDHDRDSISNSSKKNVTISVASVFNQKQKEIFQGINQMGVSKENENENQKNKIFQNQIQNHTINQYQLHNFQPILNAEISSPTSDHLGPLGPQYQCQNINPSGSLNNSRCSSPWIVMQTSPQLFNNYQNHGNMLMQNFNNNQKQGAKHPNSSSKESKQMNTNNDELLLRYVLDNNNSNVLNQISPSNNQESKSTLKSLRNNLEIKKNNQKQKNLTSQQIQGSIQTTNLQLTDQTNNNQQINSSISSSPKANAINTRSSSSCSTSSYQTPPPNQQQHIYNNQFQTNIMTTHSLKQFSSPLNIMPTTSQLINQNQLTQNQGHQNYIPYNNPSQLPSSSKIKHSQVPLVLAPIVSKTASNMPIGLGLNQFGQTTMFPPNIPIIPNLLQPTTTLPISQIGPVQNQESIRSPSLQGNTSSFFSNNKNELTMTNAKTNKINEDLSVKKLLKVPLTTSEDEEITSSKTENHDDRLKDKFVEFEVEDLDEENKSNRDIYEEKNDKNSLEKKYDRKKQDSVDKALLNLDPENRKSSQALVSSNHQNNSISPSKELNFDISKEYYRRSDSGNIKLKTNEIDQSNSNVELKNTEGPDSDQNTKYYPVSEHLFSKSPLTDLKNTNQSQNQAFAGNLNNLCYHFPSYGMQEGQNILNGIALSAPPLNSKHSSSNPQNQNQFGHSFQHFPHFNAIQPAIPVPFPFPAQFSGPHTQFQAINQGATQIHQAHPAPFLIPFIQPVSQGATQTGKLTPTPGSSPTASQITPNQLTIESAILNESSANSTNVNPQKNASNLYYSHQIPISSGQSQISDGNFSNFNNMMTFTSVSCPNQQIQSQQNLLMMMMVGNGNQAPNFNIGSQSMPNKNLNNGFPNFQQNHQVYNNQMVSTTSNNISKIQKTKKSCYNCGSFNHTAYECNEPTFDNSANSIGFKLNYKPNFSTNHSQNDVKNEKIIGSPKTKQPKNINKNSIPLSSSQRQDN